MLIGILAAGTQYAQIKFEKGYIITNSGEKTEVLIKNQDWKNNPLEIEYKSEDSAPSKKENIKNIQEFGINEGSRYIRKTVMIDLSSDNLGKMSDHKSPDFKERTLFLKYLVDGKATLLYYDSGDITRLFYALNDAEPQQLVYKSYYINNSNIAYNEDYKTQILENLNCGVDNKLIERIAYTKKDLTKVFAIYNNCSGGESVEYKKEKNNRDLFNLNIRPGINFTSFKSSYSNFYSNSAKFDTKTSFRIGLEAEFILPFNKNKWALFIEPTYQSYKAETTNPVYLGPYLEYNSQSSIDYKSIEVPLGVRHYFFLDNQSKIFVNAGYVIDFKLKSSYNIDGTAYDIKQAGNFIFGAGFKYKDRFSAEFRVGTSRDLLHNYHYMISYYKTTSVILGYTLF